MPAQRSRPAKQLAKRLGLNCSRRSFVLLAVALASACLASLAAADPRPIRLGSRGRVTAVNPGFAPQSSVTAAVAGELAGFPVPRLAGFSPLVAITATSERSRDDLDYEHDLQPFYSCNPDVPPEGPTCGSLNPPADSNFTVGFLDSGAVVDLVSGSAASRLGVVGPYLTHNSIPIIGVGGEVNAAISYPIGYYAAGLSAIGESGLLDPIYLVGHSNVSIVAAPPLHCGGAELIVAIVGTPFMSFYHSMIWVDSPRKVVVEGQVYKSPDVIIQDPFLGLPVYEHDIAMELGGLTPVSTSGYYFNLQDLEDLDTPGVPTQLTFAPGVIPTGGVFFATIQVLQGVPGPTNPVQSLRVMVDTGSQGSIISPGVAANLSLPQDPDFTVDICGVGGLSPGHPGYYIDYVKINAFGGALEFSNAPLLVLDLLSPEGGPLDGVLGMNFFWNRNVAFEPALDTTSFLHVSAPIPVARADFDVDQRVDGDDYAIYAFCETGADGAVTPDCLHLDMDQSGTVDLKDFLWLQRCYSGPDQPADVTCGPK